MRKTRDAGRLSCGVLTVETALVMGIILALTFSAVVYAGYLHDRAVLKEMAVYYAEALLHLKEEPVDFDGHLEITRLEEQNILRTNSYADGLDVHAIEARFAESATEKMLFSEVTGASVSIGQTKVVLRYTGAFRLKLGALVESILSFQEGLSGSVEQESGMAPEEFIRLCHGIIWRDRKEGSSSEEEHCE